MELTPLASVLVLLASAVIATTVFKRLHLPPILGYLLVGTIVGPYGIGLINNTEITLEIAEYGVVFLMFTIGLEFSLSKLLALKKLVFGLGALQVVLTTLITCGISALLGASVASSVAIGAIIAMSSTAISLKQLQDQMELNSPHGYNALGILLCQDIAVIAFLILIPSLAVHGQSIIGALLKALLKASSVMAIIVFVGRAVLRPLLRQITITKSLELFTLTILLVTLGTAWLTDSQGLSLALGAFLAGMMLGETQYRHQIDVEIRPFRDVLLGLFFITIGMLLNIDSLAHIGVYVLILLLGLIIGKALIIALLCRLFSSTTIDATRSALVLAQGGEFSFALLALAVNNQLITQEHNQIILAALIFSMAIAPFLIRFNQSLVRHLFAKTSRQSSQDDQANMLSSAHSLNNHIIICGYGRVGQNIARFLETEGFEFLALDMDPKRVEEANLAGDNVRFADSRNFTVLQAAGLDRAKALIISFYDLPSTYKILQQVRTVYRDLPILVRANDDKPLASLQAAGATEVVPETLETSLTLAFQALILLGIPPYRALHRIRQVRQSRYELLHRVFPSHYFDEKQEDPKIEQQLSVVNIPPGALCIDQSLDELDLAAIEVTVTAICRDGIKRPDPEPTTTLKAGDVLVLYGTQANREEAEKRILGG